MKVEAEIGNTTGANRTVQAKNLGQLQNKIQPYFKDEKVFKINIYEKKLVRSFDGLAIKDKK